jgi:hypothetical protein
MKNNMVKVTLLAIVLCAATAQAQEKKPERNSATRTQRTGATSYLNVETDPANEGTQRITMHKNGEVYKIKLVHEKVTEIYIDDKKIPEENFPQYEPMIKKLLAQIKEDQEQAARDREQAARDRQQAEKDREQAARDRVQSEKDREQAGRDRLQADQDRKQAEQDRARAEVDRGQALKHREQADRDRQQAVKDRARAERDRAQAEIDRKQAEEDRKLLAALIDDLVKENLIQSKDDLYAVQLSEESLIVNDKKQPAELHQKLKAKYLKTPGTRFTFTNRSGNSGFSIQRDH